MKRVLHEKQNEEWKKEKSRREIYKRPVLFINGINSCVIFMYYRLKEKKLEKINNNAIFRFKKTIRVGFRWKFCSS